MNIIKYYSTANPYYKNNVNKIDSRYTTFQSHGPIGLMLHSVGVPQPSAKVFADQWNRSSAEVAVHAVLQADGTVYQCLPWNYRGIHCGGSANNTHVGVEMTEPACIKYSGGATFTCSNMAEAKKQAEGTYKAAVQLFAYLCKTYGLNPMTAIISHAEGYKKSVASGHSDPEHLWNQLGMGYTMDTFRNAVKAAMSGVAATAPTYKSGWNKNATGWWYVHADGSYPISQWEKINGKWYYFDQEGYMVTGWLCLDGVWYYLDDSGAMVTGTKTITTTHHFADSGALMVDGAVSGGAAVAEWKNGSTSEPVYADTAKTVKIGSLNPWEICDCLGTVGGMYIVRYPVDGTSGYKVGLVEYAGGVSA